MYTKKTMEQDTRKLTFFVIFMLMLVAVVFGLGPLI
jgi:hypothetical protein